MKLTPRIFFLAAILWTQPLSPVWAADAPGGLPAGQAGAGGAASDSRSHAPAPSLRKVGLVNLNRVFKEFSGTKATETRLEELSQQKQTEREKMVEEIRNMRDELALLNDANRDKQREKIDDKLKALAQFDQQAREQLQGERDQAIDKLLKEIEGIVTHYAKQNGYDLILTERAALFFVPEIDVTNEIVTLLNQGKKSS